MASMSVRSPQSLADLIVLESFSRTTKGIERAAQISSTCQRRVCVTNDRGVLGLADTRKKEEQDGIRIYEGEMCAFTVR